MGEPRHWLVEPRLFGSATAVAWREPPGDAFDHADYQAAQLQHRMIAGLRKRMDSAVRAGRKISLTTIARHELFPYTYDALAKAMRGSTTLTLQLYAGAVSALEALIDNGGTDLRPEAHAGRRDDEPGPAGHTARWR